MSIISKNTITRLLKDVKEIIKNPLIDNGIYYKHDETDMLKGYAMIIGPEDTPYFGGFYFFEFVFTTDYPHSPPKVTYCTNGDSIRFHPNLYKCGKVCLSILNTWAGDQWTSCQTISTILLTLCTLLGKDPFLNEPGITKTHPDINSFNEIIDYKNIEIAILRMIEKNPHSFLPKFDIFYNDMKSIFLKNYEKILKHLEMMSVNESKIIKMTSHYNFVVRVNYKLLYENYKNVYESIIKLK